MRDRIGSVVVAVLGLAVLGMPRLARAQTYDFATCDPSATVSQSCSSTTTSCCKEAASAGSTFLLSGGSDCSSGSCAILIPMDFCHQGTSTTASTAASTWCANKVSNDGSVLTYGLVYRLIQNGIPVYWVVNPSKFPVPGSTEIPQTVDMWVLDSSASNPPGTASSLTGRGTRPAPVKKMKGGFTSATFGYDTTYTYGYKEFPVRGSAFIIAASDRANFNKFVNRQSPYTSWAARSGCYTGTGSGGPTTCYDFTNVNMFEIQPTAYLGWTNFTGTCSSSGITCESTSDCTGTDRCKFQGATTLTAPPGTTGAINFRANEAPIAALMNYSPPKIARYGAGGVAQKWLGQANLEDAASSTCATTGIFTPSDAVYCAVTESNIASGVLKTAGFGWLWLDHQALTCSSSGGTSISKVEQFLTAVSGSYTPGNVMAIADGILDESCTSYTDHLLGSQGGIGVSAASGSTPSPLILRYPQSLFMQWGDTASDYATGTGGSGWSLTGGALMGYTSQFGVGSDTLHRLVSQDVSTLCTNEKSSSTCDKSASSPSSYIAPVGDTGWDTVSGGESLDLTAYGRYRNVSTNGIVYYLPGTQIQQHTAELRMLLDSVLATPLGTITQVPPTTIEATRSSPVVATIENRNALVQGTYEYVSPAPIKTTVTDEADVASFEFPYQKGHFRAVDDSNISSSGTAFSSATALFDSANSSTMPTVANTGCSAGADGSCRYIFTTTTTTFLPTIVPFDESHRSALVASLGISSWASSLNQNAFIDKILAGHLSGATYVPALGGVDRSTAAVIPASPLVNGSRPTIAYFGATDGMLHAVCASIGGKCTTLGRELWAYIPRTNLPLLRLNNARVDGSPRVVDALVDVTSGTGTGTKGWRTILTFQTGTGDVATAGETPAVYALDVSDPTNPVVLWEYDTVGQGLSMAVHEVDVSGTDKWMAYAQTNIASGSAGTQVVPIDVQTGTNTLGWTFTYTYPNPPRTLSDSPVPSTGIPGGAVGVFQTGSTDGLITRLAFNDLYGDLWEIDPATGDSKYHDGLGANIPLFTFSTDYHAIGAKPAIYSDGSNQFALFATGGYADPADSVWGTGVTQYLMAVSLTSYPTSSTASLTDFSGAPYVPVKQSIGTDKSFAQALIVGNQVFVTADSSDINSASYGSGSGTGKLFSYNLGNNTAGTTVVLATGGASSVAADSTALYVGSNSMQQLANSATSTIGNSVDSETAPTMARTLWLRTE